MRQNPLEMGNSTSKSDYFGQQCRDMTIEKLDKDTVLHFAKRPRQGSIHGLSLKICGHVDGFAIVKWYGLTDTISGQVDLNTGGDWYQDSCTVSITRLTSRTGSLAIKYKFFGTNNF